MMCEYFGTVSEKGDGSIPKFEEENICGYNYSYTFKSCDGVNKL